MAGLADAAVCGRSAGGPGVVKAACIARLPADACQPPLDMMCGHRCSSHSRRDRQQHTSSGLLSCRGSSGGCGRMRTQSLCGGRGTPSWSAWGVGAAARSSR